MEEDRKVFWGLCVIAGVLGYYEKFGVALIIIALVMVWILNCIHMELVQLRLRE